jgi:hypothetical protein
MIDKALEAAKIEWGNISNLSYLITNLIEMNKQLIRHAYSTPEALDVFTTLDTKATERLGLSEGLALSFGSGYGCVVDWTSRI